MRGRESTVGDGTFFITCALSNEVLAQQKGYLMANMLQKALMTRIINNYNSIEMFNDFSYKGLGNHNFFILFSALQV